MKPIQQKYNIIVNTIKQIHSHNTVVHYQPTANPDTKGGTYYLLHRNRNGYVECVGMVDRSVRRGATEFYHVGSFSMATGNPDESCRFEEVLYSSDNPLNAWGKMLGRAQGLKYVQRWLSRKITEQAKHNHLRHAREMFRQYRNGITFGRRTR